jgi:hypothetical protein
MKTPLPILLKFLFEIPPNTTATVFIPAANAADVTEGGNPAGEADGARFLREEDGCVLFEVGAGVYRFASRSVPASSPGPAEGHHQTDAGE